MVDAAEADSAYADEAHKDQAITQTNVVRLAIGICYMRLKETSF